MNVYHSFFSPEYGNSIVPHLVGTVQAEAGTDNGLERAMWEIAGAHHTEPHQGRLGSFHIPGIGYFWTDGKFPNYEANARRNDDGVYEGADSLIAHYRGRTLLPV